VGVAKERKCPFGWSPILKNCIKPLGKTRRMSFPFWETPAGTGCDAGYHVSPYVQISCILDCPVRMTEVSLATACEKDEYQRTDSDAKCRPGYENFFEGCLGCRSGFSAYGGVCVGACPAGIHSAVLRVLWVLVLVMMRLRVT
jgi:hypothetical protein